MLRWCWYAHFKLHGCGSLFRRAKTMFRWVSAPFFLLFPSSHHFFLSSLLVVLDTLALPAQLDGPVTFVVRALLIPLYPASVLFNLKE